VNLEPAAVRVVVDWFSLSVAALRMLDPGQQPILWPEHFDVAILLDNRSCALLPGDDFRPRPYAYLSAYDHDGGPFWNAPFGALRNAEDSPTEDLGGLGDRAERCCAGLSDASLGVIDLQ
jgi:hypothetical protein